MGRKIVNIRLFINYFIFFDEKTFSLQYKFKKLRVMKKTEMIELAAMVADEVVKKLKTIQKRMKIIIKV